MPSAVAETMEAVAALGLLAGGLAYASAWPTSQLFGRTLVAGADPSEVALTYDDGPNPAVTPQLLELLVRHNVRATFFAIGSFARREPALIRRIVAEGHLLANHTMTHPNLSLQSAARIRQELADCTSILEDIAGQPIRYFRPPFGARRPAVLRIARELGLTPILWNVTGHDWNPRGPDSITARILANLTKGIARNRRRNRSSNLLLHDGGHLNLGAPRLDTVAATQCLLSDHAGTPTRFVTVDAWETAKQSPAPEAH